MAPQWRLSILVILLQESFPVTSCSNLALCGANLALIRAELCVGCPSWCTRRMVTSGESGVLFLSIRRTVVSILILEVLPSRQLVVLVLTVVSMSDLLFTIETISILAAVFVCVRWRTRSILPLLGRLRLSSMSLGKVMLSSVAVLVSALVVLVTVSAGLEVIMVVNCWCACVLLLIITIVVALAIVIFCAALLTCRFCCDFVVGTPLGSVYFVHFEIGARTRVCSCRFGCF